MRACLLAVALLGPTLGLAQEEAPEPKPMQGPADEPAAQTAAPTETTAEPEKPKKKRRHAEDAAVEAPAAGGAPSSDRDQVLLAAKRFFSDLLIADAQSLVAADSAVPFFIEDKKLSTPDELQQEWLKHLRGKRTDLLTLYGIEILTPAEMEKKYGKPPSRLSQFPWKGPFTYLAVANLSGHAAIALMQRHENKGWRVFGYTD